MKVRFNSNYRSKESKILAYETDCVEVTEYDEVSKRWGRCYYLPLLGYVLVKKLEPAIGNEIDAVDVFTELTNLNINK